MTIKEAVTEELTELREILGEAEKRLKQAEMAEDHKAVKLLLEAVEIAPDYWEAWNMLGKRYLALHLEFKAMDCFLKATGCKPDNAEAWLNYADILLQRGHHKAAVTNYKYVQRMEPGNLRAHLGEAAAHLSDDRPVQAAEAYARVLDILESMEHGVYTPPIACSCEECRRG